MRLPEEKDVTYSQRATVGKDENKKFQKEIKDAWLKAAKVKALMNKDFDRVTLIFCEVNYFVFKLIITDEGKN